MERATVPTRIYRFGPFELIPSAAELRKSGVRLKLQDQPLQVLCTLLEHSGELVSREQLRQQLWPEGTFVDFEHGLNTAVKKIRDVLGDDADTPRYVETVPRKGYRFIGAVSGEGWQPGVAATPVTRGRKKWGMQAAVALAGVGLLAGTAALVFSGASAPNLRIVATRQLTFSGQLAPYSAIESDGRRVYYFKFNDGRLYSVPATGGTESSSATKFVQPMILHIARDGSALLVKELTGPTGTFANRIWVLPTNGGPARPFGDIEADCAAWSPDGKTVAFARNGALYLTQDDGSSYRKLADLAGDPWWIRWSPDGQKLRLSVFDSKTQIAAIWEVRRDGRRPPIILNLGGHRNTCCGVWTRAGRHFLFREERDQRTDYWVASEGRSPFRSRRPLLLGGGSMAMVGVGTSPLEDTIFVVGNQGAVMTFKFDPAHRRLVQFFPELSIRNVAFSADGKWMLVCQERYRESVLFRARSDGGEWQPLTDRKLWVHQGQFSRDGTRIALMGKWPDRPWKIYWVAAEGGALHELNAPIVSQADPNWMPDGERILFGQPPQYFAETGEPRAIYLHDLQTNSTSKVPASEGWFSPRIAPDGRSFLALSIDEHKLGLYDFVNSRWRVLVENEQDRVQVPSWSPDGGWAYVNIYGNSHYLLRIRVRDGAAEKVVSYREMFASPYCWTWNSAPDGSLLVSCLHLNADIYALRYE